MLIPPCPVPSRLVSSRMAPPSKKAVQAKQQKVLEDKTFGLKNKNKSKKVQQYVQTIAKQTHFVGRSRKEVEEAEKLKAEKAARKAAEEAQKKEIQSIFKGIGVGGGVGGENNAASNKYKKTFGQDPKSILCEYFKQGKCVRGNKCKFSHDEEQVRKVTKIDLYTDPREAEAQAQAAMDGWDQKKLQQCIQEKNISEHICHHFIDAVENKKYGWLWVCPNGENCHYRHALPPGYVLKAQQKAEEKQREEEEAQFDIGEEIEKERAKLDLSKCTPLTEEIFKKWREEQEQKRVKEAEKRRVDEQKKSGGKSLMSGRDLFRYDPSLFADDEEAADEYEFEDVKENEWDATYDVQSGLDGASDIQALHIESALYEDDENLPSDDDDDDDDTDHNGFHK